MALCGYNGKKIQYVTSIVKLSNRKRVISHNVEGIEALIKIVGIQSSK